MFDYFESNIPSSPYQKGRFDYELALTGLHDPFYEHFMGDDEVQEGDACSFQVH